MSRSLSPSESKLILHLEWEKQAIVTIEDAMEILGCSYDRARQVLSRLARKRWLAPVKPGTYELIPAERGEHAFPDPNPLLVGHTLVEPYYFSYSTAAFFHGLSSQAAATVYIATTTRARRAQINVRGTTYRLVRQTPRKFFGATEVSAYGTSVMMADLEKTMVDCLDRPTHAGGMPEVAAMMARGRHRLNWTVVSEYALRFGIQSLVQRLGYLADVLDIHLPQEDRARLLGAVGKSYTYLGQTARWGTGGKHVPVWQLVVNIPRQELFSEIEIV